MSRHVPAHHKPFPELVEPVPHATPYSIVDTTGKPWLPTNGMTSLVERKLLVPLVPGAVSVARHELAHVKWSPKRVPKVAFDLRVLMAVEDARLNLGMRALGLPVLLTEQELAQVARLARKDLEDRDPHSFVLRAVAAQGTNAVAAVLGALAGEPAALDTVARRNVRTVRLELLRARGAHREHVASFSEVKRIAADLARTLALELGVLGFPPRLPFQLELAGAGCCLGHGSGIPAERRGRGDDGDAPAGDHPSGKMRVVTAPLVHPTPAPRGGRRGRGRAVAEGLIPRHLHRWSLDRAVFHQAGRGRGGTVLIDTSGSMSLDAAGVDAILAASSGAARIALYSGAGGVGELRIVASDGRRADAKDLVPFGRGNIVDEPALAWLARQDGPRLWISDGGVTGVDDRPSAALQRRCQEIVHRSAIHRVRSVREAAAFLAHGGRHAGVA